MINYVEDVKPVSYVKAHTAEMLKQVEESRTPILITQNGEAKAVLVDVVSWQNSVNAVNLAKLIGFGENDIKNGNVVSHENAKKRFQKTLNIK